MLGLKKLSVISVVFKAFLPTCEPNERYSNSGRALLKIGPPLTDAWYTIPRYLGIVPCVQSRRHQLQLMSSALGSLCISIAAPVVIALKVLNRQLKRDEERGVGRKNYFHTSSRHRPNSQSKSVKMETRKIKSFNTCMQQHQVSYPQNQTRSRSRVLIPISHVIKCLITPS